MYEMKLEPSDVLLEVRKWNGTRLPGGVVNAEVHRDTHTLFGQFTESEISDAANAWRAKGYHGAYDGPEPVWTESKSGRSWSGNRPDRVLRGINGSFALALNDMGEVCCLHDRNTTTVDHVAGLAASPNVLPSAGVEPNEGVGLNSILDGIIKAYGIGVTEADKLDRLNTAAARAAMRHDGARGILVSLGLRDGRFPRSVQPGDVIKK
eukprot:6484053-Amphidinium_carterae.1